jgi:hypothetical protein
MDAERLSFCFNLFYLIEVTRGSSVEIQRNLPDHFEWLLAVDDQLDQVALTARKFFNHILGCGPDARICAVDLRR